MAYLDEEGNFDYPIMEIDIEDYPYDYVGDFIFKFIPIDNGSPETEVLPQWDSLIYDFLFEVENKKIEIPVSLEDFSKDKELLKRIEK